MFYVQMFILGLPIAGLFALLAIGIVMIYRASHILNLAHGAMAMFTAFVFYALTNAPKGPRLPIWLAVIVALVFAGTLGGAIERVLLRPLRDRPVLASVIMTVGALALLTAIAGAIWGYDRQDAPSILPRGRSISLAGAVIGLDRLLMIAITGALVGLVILLFKRSMLGIAMRAVSDDRRASVLMGVPADRVSTVTWVIGSVLAGIAGILLSPIIGLQPVNITLLAIPAYAAALFGGLSSFPMTLAGSAVLGIMYSMIPSLPVIRTADFPGAREVAIFATVILFLFFRWEQLFGSDLAEEEV